MTGSPTLLINGVDPFALGTSGECSIACRLYRDENNQIVPAPSGQHHTTPGTSSPKRISVNCG